MGAELPFGKGIAGDVELAIVDLKQPADFPKTILRCIRCDAASFRDACASSCLSADERARCAQIKSQAARRRFVVSRYALRLSLAEVLGMAPAEIAIHQSSSGKPYITQGWQFSLSHAGDWALLALHPHRAVGVDLEMPRMLTHPKKLLQRFKANHLIDRPSEAEVDLNQEALKRWNRTEALVKAAGLGMSRAQDLRRIKSGHYQLNTMQIQVRVLDFLPAPEYLAAFAILLREDR